MSWSINSVGKAKAVALDVATKAAQQVCQEPEQTIKGLVVQAVQIALEKFPENTAVQVEANGSQWVDSTVGTVSNSLHFDIKPLYGFVE